MVGGFAIRAAGFVRHTMDVDLFVETGPENEAQVPQIQLPSLGSRIRQSDRALIVECTRLSTPITQGLRKR